MGSSSKNKGNQQRAAPQKAKAPPKMGKIPDGSGGFTSYYEDPSQLPAEGGWVRPPALPGQPQGTGLNFMMPPPPPPQPRQQLAQVMNPGTRNGIYYPGDRGSAWMEGGRGGEHASGGHW